MRWNMFRPKRKSYKTSEKPQTTRYYVYFHKQYKEMVYVGKGCYARAWEIWRRSSYHSDWIYSRIELGNRANYVEIYEDLLSEEEAIELERELIKEYKPRFNITGNRTTYFEDLQKEEEIKVSEEESVKQYIKEYNPPPCKDD